MSAMCQAETRCAGSPAHLVSVPPHLRHPGPDLRFPRAGVLSLGSAVAVVGAASSTAYALLDDGRGTVIAGHLVPTEHAPLWWRKPSSARPIILGSASGF